MFAAFWLQTQQESCISNTTIRSVSSRLTFGEPSARVSFIRRLQTKLNRRNTRKRVVRISLVGFNMLLLAAVAGVVLTNPHSGQAVQNSAIISGTDKTAANPLDQLASANIAVTVARMSGLQEATAVTNQADSQVAELTMAPTSESVTTKPQVVASAFKSRLDIKNYVAKEGDTVSSIAAKFGVNSESIRWSNNLSGNVVTVGQNLVIPPMNGIVYTVAAGDTADSLASKFGASKDKIIAFNDAELSGFKPGERIIIPDGTKKAPVVVTRSYSVSYPWGSSAVYGYNGYDYGYCTWYVASRISVPSNWGNANTWDNLAPLSGWTVSAVPRVGAVAQTDRGSEGHVAVVEAVSADGSQIKYSDMNGLAGWGHVGYSGWVSARYFEHYIYR